MHFQEYRVNTDDTRVNDLRQRRQAPLFTPTDIAGAANIVAGMNGILADVFALFMKRSKSFHWHMSGAHFRDYHLLLDELADQLYAMTDPIGARVRKIGGTSLRSVGRYHAPKQCLTTTWIS
jgi:starvation-inducible DNA-binding protein